MLSCRSRHPRMRMHNCSCASPGVRVLPLRSKKFGCAVIVAKSVDKATQKSRAARQPGCLAVRKPGSQAARQPGSQAARQKGSDSQAAKASRQPSIQAASQAVRQPGSQEASLLGRRHRQVLPRVSVQHQLPAHSGELCAADDVLIRGPPHAFSASQPVV